MVSPFIRLAQEELEINKAKADATNAVLRARELQDYVDQLVLATSAMWTILRDKLGVTDEELAARMAELDLADGKRDGKIARATAPCAKCGKALSGRRMRCMYCGEMRKDALPT